MAIFRKSTDLHERAGRTIPLASQTFSKSAMQFVEGASPLFLDRGEGCRVWDVDGNIYIDFVLGLLPVVLGYRDPDVDGAIRAQLEKGITFSLATELEIELAERLVRLIPCAEMVRFGKNGSDVTTAAVRLARAVTRRDKVAVCGYHGWHDWYIGTTARSLGVPDAVKALSVKFTFNDPDSLERVLRAEPDCYAAVILEPSGVESPAEGFLEFLREITERYGVLLIFDEIITGFRLDMGGAQRRYGVTPDLACFGKAMGNGMPISAIVGRAEFMRRMEDIFFSGTFGGETLSLAAAIATIDKMEATNGISRIHRTGGRLKQGVRQIFGSHDLSEIYGVFGEDWWPRLSAVAASHVNSITATSLLRQELVANGLLVPGGLNICLAHDDEAVVSETLRSFELAAESLERFMAEGDPAAHLRGKPIQPVFQVR